MKFSMKTLVAAAALAAVSRETAALGWVRLLVFGQPPLRKDQTVQRKPPGTGKDQRQKNNAQVERVFHARRRVGNEVGCFVSRKGGDEVAYTL